MTQRKTKKPEIKVVEIECWSRPIGVFGAIEVAGAQREAARLVEKMCAELAEALVAREHERFRFFRFDPAVPGVRGSVPMLRCEMAVLSMSRFREMQRKAAAFDQVAERLQGLKETVASAKRAAVSEMEADDGQG